jgi:spore coat protein U-like protein
MRQAPITIRETTHQPADPFHKDFVESRQFFAPYDCINTSLTIIGYKIALKRAIMNLTGYLAAATLAACFASSAMAATDTDTFDVTLTIVDACEVTANNDMAFGTQNFLNVAIDATADFTVQCTTGTVGTISLDQGLGSGGSFTFRYMKNGTDQIGYALYTDAARTNYWGDGTSGSSTVAHTGTGAETTLTIYGRTSIQSEPPANIYTDTITVTVTY